MSAQVGARESRRTFVLGPFPALALLDHDSTARHAQQDVALAVPGLGRALSRLADDVADGGGGGGRRPLVGVC